MSKISFDLRKIEIKLENGSNLNEIGNMLQNFTSSYLYNDSETLKGIDKLEDFPYTNCKLIQIDNGYVLDVLNNTQNEKITRRKITVFNKEMMIYLTSIYNDVDDVDYEDVDDVDDINEIDNIDDINDIDNINDVDDIDDINDVDDVDDVDIDDEDNIIDDIDDIDIDDVDDDDDDDNIIDDIEDIYHFDDVDDVDDEDIDVKTFFRMFLKSLDDQECNEHLYINKKMIKNLDDKNNIDLIDTIKLSFTSFLEMKNIKSQVSVIFHENTFAEVLIMSQKKISNEIIEIIENEALLDFNDGDIVFFVYRDVEMNKEIEENERNEEKIWTNNPILDLLIFEKSNKIENKIGNKIKFYYEYFDF